MNLQTVAHLCSLLNDCLWYHKLWGPSKRVVTLSLFIVLFLIVVVLILGQVTPLSSQVTRGRIL